MTILTEGRHAGEHILSESPGYRSREEGVVAESQTLKAGQVIGRVTRGAVTVTPGAVVGTGTGSIGTVTADALAPAGVYKLLIIEPASNAGAFAVYRPDGTMDGTGNVAVAYNGTINFTLADATDFVAGDYILITVAYAAGSGQWVMHDPEGTDGREVAYGLLFDAVTTGLGETAKAVAHVRDCEVKQALLAWDDQDTTEKAAALATLANAGIIARS